MVVKKGSLRYKLAYWYQPDKVAVPRLTYTPLFILRMLIGVTFIPALWVLIVSTILVFLVLCLFIAFCFGHRPLPFWPKGKEDSKWVPLSFLRFKSGVIWPITVAFFCVTLFLTGSINQFWMFSWVPFIVLLYFNIVAFIPQRELWRRMLIVEISD